MDLTVGLTIAIVGMGGTLAILSFLTLLVSLLKRFFPYRESDESNNPENS